MFGIKCLVSKNYYANKYVDVADMFAGGPGSGRSTQCELISLYSGYVHVSSGEALRKEVMSGSSRGLLLYDCMYNGDPLPNPMMTGVIREEMMSKIIGKGFTVKVRLSYNFLWKYIGFFNSIKLQFVKNLFKHFITLLN